ncbi:MAG: response regulator [Leptospiraceae bacterium]|nr:response regulator [Leptospiraceae bacterium]
METGNLHIIAIDDDPVSLKIICAMGSQMELAITPIQSPEEAMLYCQEHPIDILITDHEMGAVNGLEIIRQFRIKNRDAPIVMVTAHDQDNKLKLQALHAGATDFLTKPINSAEFQARMSNLAHLRHSQLALRDKARLLESEVRLATNKILERELETLQILGNAAEYRDQETGQHVIRVAHFARLIAREAGLDENQQDMLFRAAPLHDIGKIAIPDSILLKPDLLDQAEFDIMKTHTSAGYEILRHASSQFLQAGADIALTHHEKFDGTGYPQGLIGAAIPISGRITAIADVFDALSSKRRYKRVWSASEVHKYMLQQSGTHFDPDLLQLFLSCRSEIEFIQRTNSDEMKDSSITAGSFQAY